MTQDELPGASIISAIKISGVEFVFSVPDITTSEALLRPLAKDQDMRLVRVCKEDEAIGASAGLSYCNKRALLLTQQTGLFDSIYAMRGVAVEFSLPICLMVGLLNAEPGVPPAEQKSYGIRIVEPILDAMGIKHELIDTEEDVAKIGPAIEQAYEVSEPVVMLIGRSPSP